MKATIRLLARKIGNPGQGYEQIINGGTPHARLVDLHKQAEQRMRGKQIARYTQVCTEANDIIDANTKDLADVMAAVARLRKDLKRGLVEPAEVMKQVAESMKGVQAVIADVRRVEQDEEAATAMVDQSPEDYEQDLIERFPVLAEQGTPYVTDEYLRGEEDSPFRDGGED
jgi:hypothetical protein